MAGINDITVKVNVDFDEDVTEKIRQIVREEIAAARASIHIEKMESANAAIRGRSAVTGRHGQGSADVSTGKIACTAITTERIGTPRKVNDLRPVVKKMLHVLVEHEIPVSSLERVLEELRNAAHTSTVIQERWAKDDYEGYDKM